MPDAHVGLSASNNNRSSTSTSTFPSSSRNDYGCEFPPALTTNERALLRKHAGCFKCRRFYAGHQQKDYTLPHPNPKNYRELTEADALKVKRDGDKPKVKKESTNAVGLDDELVDNIAAAIREESPVACGVLGYGTDSEDSGCVVANISDNSFASTTEPHPPAKPISVPHFTLRALVHDASGPCVDLPIRMLIDCGSSTVLIRSEVVDRLKLKRKPLPTAISLDSAWGSKGTIASNFVKLRVSVRSLAWTSHSVRALVVDSLCAPIILGQPFLAINNLVLDCAARTCIDKSCNFDLLNPCKRPPKEDGVHVTTDIRSKLRDAREKLRRSSCPKSPKYPPPTVEEVVDDEFFTVRNPPLPQATM